MYNAHRGMVPAPNARLTELFDQLRQEYENQTRSTGEFEHQCALLLIVFFPHLLFGSIARVLMLLSFTTIHWRCDRHGN